jgi:hypothetical protein
MDDEKYIQIVWLSLLKDFLISFCIGYILTLLFKNEFFGAQVVYVCLFFGTLLSTKIIYRKMIAGVERGTTFLQINLPHKIILFVTMVMNIASVTIIPNLSKKSENPYGIVFIMIFVSIIIHYFAKWWNFKANNFNQKRIHQYMNEEKTEIDMIVNYLLLHASDDLTFQVLKDRVNYDCVYTEDYNISSCKTLYLIDLGIAELREPLRLVAYEKACKEQYGNQKW